MFCPTRIKIIMTCENKNRLCRLGVSYACLRGTEIRWLVVSESQVNSMVPCSPLHTVWSKIYEQIRVNSWKVQCMSYRICYRDYATGIRLQWPDYSACATGIRLLFCCSYRSVHRFLIWRCREGSKALYCSPMTRPQQVTGSQSINMLLPVSTPFNGLHMPGHPNRPPD